jgi:hypothetical protein
MFVTNRSTGLNGRVWLKGNEKRNIRDRQERFAPPALISGTHKCGVSSLGAIQ